MSRVPVACMGAALFILAVVTLPDCAEAIDKNIPFGDYVRAAYYGHDLRDPILQKVYWREKNYVPGPPAEPKQPKPYRQRAARKYHYAEPTYDPEWEKEWRNIQEERKAEARRAAEKEAIEEAKRKAELRRKRLEKRRREINENKAARSRKENFVEDQRRKWERNTKSELLMLKKLVDDMEVTGAPVEPLLPVEPTGPAKNTEEELKELVGKTVNVIFKSGATRNGKTLVALAPYTIKSLIKADGQGRVGEGHELWFVVSYKRRGGGIGTWSFPVDAVEKFTEAQA